MSDTNITDVEIQPKPESEHQQSAQQQQQTFPISSTTSSTNPPSGQSIQAIGSLGGSTAMVGGGGGGGNPQGGGANGGSNGAGQKRQGGENGGPASKKPNMNDSLQGPDVVQIKVLIPSGAVGALIGKGGETMRNLKNESGCRVQMSKNQEVYHGKGWTPLPSPTHSHYLKPPNYRH